MLLFSSPSVPFAHDIPSRVAVLVFAKPEGRTLTLVMRVPLEAIRDVEFPTRGEGYPDIEKARPLPR